MRNKQDLKSISDDDLLRGLSELLQNSRRIEADLIAHMAEVDERRLYRKTSSSMYSYCTDILHLAEHEAFLRIKVARASREHPVLLEMLADGRLHLSGIVVLRPHLTEDNREMLLNRAVHKTRRQIEELVAELSPKPDVPSTIRKLPERKKKPGPSQNEQVPEPVKASNSESTQKAPEVRENAPKPTAPPASRPAVVEPLSAATYKIQFTASAGLRNKLEELQALMRSSGSESDLASVVDAAVTEKLEKLKAKRYGTTKSPRKSLEETDTSPYSRYIPFPVRRAVRERDRDRCTFVAADGRRCTETRHLEFHHIQPFGRGGDHSVGNICLLCRAHNAYVAEQDYGKEFMERFKDSDGRVSEPAAQYTSSLVSENLENAFKEVETGYFGKSKRSTKSSKRGSWRRLGNDS
jgi:hypothetical protein